MSWILDDNRQKNDEFRVVFSADLEAEWINLDKVASTDTYETIYDFVNTVGNAGHISGGAITDNLDGTIDVAAGTGLIKTTDSDTGTLKFFDWAAATDVALTQDVVNYIIVDYNSGSPQVDVVTDLTTVTRTTQFVIGAVFAHATYVHKHEGGQELSGFMHKVYFQLVEEEGIHRASGLVTSHTGTRNIAITAGIGYWGLDRINFSAVDTSGSDTFDYMYRDGEGGWTEVEDQSQISNLYYDDGDGTLGSLTVNKYGVHWLYALADGDLYVVYGQGDYTLAQAQAATVPSSLPAEISDFGFLLAKIICQQGAASFQEVVIPWTATVGVSVPTDHGGLAGLSDDDHTQYSLVDGTRSFTGTVTIAKNDTVELLVDTSSGTDKAAGVTLKNDAREIEIVLSTNDSLYFKDITANGNIMEYTPSTPYWYFSCPTSDGSDTGEVSLRPGGGVASADRGAYVKVCGNEHASQAGDIVLVAGSTGDIFVTGDTIVTGLMKLGEDSTAPSHELHLKYTNSPFVMLEGTAANTTAYIGFKNDAQEWWWGCNSADLLQTWDSTNSKAPLQIEPGSPTSLLYLDTAGLVGINTSSPGYELHVKDTSGDDPRVMCEGTGANSTARYMVKNDARTWSLGITGSDTFNIWNDTGGAGVLFISTGGDVGIGEDSTGQTLHVYHATDNAICRLKSGDDVCTIKWEDSGQATGVEAGCYNDDFTIYLDSTRKLTLKSQGLCIGTTAFNDVDEVARFYVAGNEADLMVENNGARRSAVLLKNTGAEYQVSNTSGGAFSILANSGADTTNAFWYYTPGTGTVFRNASADGADDETTQIGGGGGTSNSRGAVINLYGNEHANTGDVAIHAGNVAGGLIKMYTGNTLAVYIKDDAGSHFVGIGNNTAIWQRLHVHEDSSGAVYAHFTNSTTGATNTDGFDVGINADEKALLWNRENTDMVIGTNNTTRLTITAGGVATFNLTDDLGIVDADENGGSGDAFSASAATIDGWIQITLGGTTHYIPTTETVP